MPRLSNVKIKARLDYHYRAFNKTQLSPDPLEFPHKFTEYHDIEISAFLAATFAYGNISQILKSLERIHEIMEWKPYEFVMNYNYLKDRKLFDSTIHRFFTASDISILFEILHQIYTNNESMKYLFLLYYFPKAENLKSSLSFFSNNLLDLAKHYSEITHGLKFMFPDPAKGSACKRMNLFLRWMVRKDDLDFGLWNEISTSKLVIPVDTHVAHICKKFYLTKLNTVSWKMAEEITNNLKKFSLDDPVKYDFAICHLGARKIDF
ncbi:MAG: TIGR02757 family protein [Melioribacteraceae bacterium]|nr:TIGR02757 family protein [Melioribacteraceae bacterium]